MHLVAKQWGGAGAFVGLLRGTAYASMPLVLVTVPFLGWAAAAYWLYVTAINVRENRQLTIGRSVVVVLVPAVVIVGLGVTWIVMV